MIQLRRILFPTDFSPCAEQALTHAVYLAKRYQAELHVLHAVVLHGFYHQPEFNFVNVDTIRHQLEEAVKRQMSTMLEPHTLDQVKITRVYRQGDSAAAVILDYAKERDVDLIVLGTHGRRGLEHLLLGSTAEEVVRLSSCPVFTIRERKEPSRIEEINRILVPIDFSEHSKHALRYAKQIAKSYNARLQLLHVIEKVIHPPFYAQEYYRDLQRMESFQQRSKEALQQFLEETEGPKLSAEVHVIEGRAAADITMCAKDFASDLIVIATHGLTGIEHLLMGSVTEKVVRRASCPVFTVTVYGKNLIRRDMSSHRDTQAEANTDESSHRYSIESTH
jgi:nucleotide-binding universal stress UspA family protein